MHILFSKSIHINDIFFYRIPVGFDTYEIVGLKAWVVAKSETSKYEQTKHSYTYTVCRDHWKSVFAVIQMLAGFSTTIRSSNAKAQ